MLQKLSFGGFLRDPLRRIPEFLQFLAIFGNFFGSILEVILKRTRWRENRGETRYNHAVEYQERNFILRRRTSRRVDYVFRPMRLR